jgi:hypothetical protein
MATKLKDLTKDWMRLVFGTDLSDDCVHVDAKARKISYGRHGTNVCNGSLSLSLVRIRKVNYILGRSFHFVGHLVLDKTLASLWKESRWLDRISLNLEPSNLFSCKISFKHVESKDL